MLKDTPTPITSLSDGELKAEIAKQNRLVESLGPKLPDGGARLRKYLEKLRSELAIREKSPQILPKPVFNTLKKIEKYKNSEHSIHPISREPEEVNETVAEPESSEQSSKKAPLTTDLSEQLSALAIKCDDETVTDQEESSHKTEDLSVVPSITLHEVLRLRYLLGLPALVLSSFRWFIFTIRLVKNVVYLGALDCADPKRHFLRQGLITTWLPGTHSAVERTSSSSSLDEAGDVPERTKLTQAAEALRGFWEFVSSGGHSADSGQAVPGLICRTLSDRPDENELIWFSRLLRGTRHHNVARAGMPRDCRFVLLPTRSSDEKSESEAENKAGPPQSDRLVDEMQTLRDQIFVDVEGKDTENKKDLEFREHKSVSEFLHSGVVRSLPWMEASLELEFLKEIKTNSILADRLHRSVRLRNDPPKAPTHGLQFVPNLVLRRLASVGLGRTRLTRLAGVAGWHGFAGLLAYRFRPLSDTGADADSKEPTSEDRGLAKAFVTDDLLVLTDLYRYFRRVYDHMDRHGRYYREGKSERRNTSTVSRPVPPSSDVFPVVDSPVRVQAWVAGGNALFHPDAQRQPRILSVEESVALMQKAQKDYQEARMKRDLPTYPSLPPNTEKLYRYRDIRRDSESDLQTSEDDSSSDTEKPNEDASSTTSEESLHMEEPD